MYREEDQQWKREEMASILDSESLIPLESEGIVR